MCGIAGIVDENPSGTQNISRMVNVLSPRGPDDQGIWTSTDRRVALGHCRLAIIDLSSFAHQPMSDESAKIWITYNGEIYNFKQLRDELSSEGVRFMSRSDTEVILRLYQKQGMDCVKRLRGMFAFAIWDDFQKTLFAARDRIGIKPFYYYWDQARFVFASEIKALIRSGAVTKKINDDTLASYLKYGSLRDPQTIYQGIHSLEPAHYLIFRDGKLETKRYWNLSNCFLQDQIALPMKEAVSLFQTRLQDSVQSHFVADVPVGIFLSGGIDSSALVSVAKGLFNSPIKTISVNLPYSEFDESPFATKVARRFRTDHIEAQMREEALAYHIERFFQVMDQPTIDGLNTYLVSWTAKEHGLKVCLSGLGGDELFGGYRSFQDIPRLYRLLKALAIFNIGKSSCWWLSFFPLMHKLKRVSDMYRPVLSLRNIYDNYRSVFSRNEISDLLGRDCPTEMTNGLRDDGGEKRSIKQNISFYEMATYMTNQLLRDSDVFGMCHSIEIRVPFLDHKVIESLSRIPDNFKYDQAVNKNFLVQCVGNLPAEVYQRPKRGFAVPLEKWMRVNLRQEVKEILFNEPLFDKRSLKRHMKGFEQKTEHWSRVWSLFVLAKWLDQRKGD